jgi:pyridoxal phosphate enzyme (YggS family)
MDIKNNIITIKQKIELAKQKAGRSDEITLIAVSKTKPVELIEQAYNCGQIDFGENRVQEAFEKAEHFQNSNIKYSNIKWHLIGHLQSNKVKHAVKFASLIHSVDSFYLAEALQQRLDFEAKNGGKTSQDILVQVNTSAEDSKSGVEPEKAIEFIKEISQFKRLNIKGLMTIGKLTENQNEIRDCFKKLNEIFLFAKYNLYSENMEMKHLSMGMSGDFEIAIEEGATLIRVGSSIFGNR